MNSSRSVNETERERSDLNLITSVIDWVKTNTQSYTLAIYSFLPYREISTVVRLYKLHGMNGV
jgi:hypothetical protein